MLDQSPSRTPVFRGTYVGLDGSNSGVGSGSISLGVAIARELRSATGLVRDMGFRCRGLAVGEEERFAGC
jgi:hypothetical protein